MRRGGRMPSVLAEISARLPGEPPTWRLRRADYEALASLLNALRGARAVLVTGDEEGKSAAAVGLATVATAAGRRTALLECDLESPSLAEAVGLAGAPGLHEYLRGEASARQILQPLVLAGPASGGASAPLTCVVAGAATPNAATLVASNDFEHALLKLRNAYDFVVVDGPPLAAGGGSLAAVAMQVDATLACVDRARLRRGKPRRALKSELPALDAPTTGLILRG